MATRCASCATRVLCSSSWYRRVTEAVAADLPASALTQRRVRNPRPELCFNWLRECEAIREIAPHSCPGVDACWTSNDVPACVTGQTRLVV